MRLMGEKKRCFMKTLEEKKKVWEAEREQKIAERMAKAAAWRAEAQALRLKKLSPILPGVVEKLEKIETKVVKKIAVKKKAVRPKGVKKAERIARSRKKPVKPKLEKIFVKKKVKKLGFKRKAVAGKKSAPALAKEIGEKVKEEIRKPIKAFEKKLNKKIEEISAVKAELRLKKKRVKRKKPALKPRAGEEIVKPPEKELVTAILEEPLLKAELAKENPKIEKPEEKKPVEIETLSGIFTDISMPKTKEEKEFDWSAKRFKELEEKLQRLRRF